ncbi:MAG: DNA polymerase III subunit delta [Spirochaetaceae bacterium]|jgi:DNA polymerase-3 subunit delta|nr:DNA polymerase III subunit delta [Spirochaetaceae bacterium]
MKGRSYIYLGPEFGRKQDAITALKKNFNPPAEENIYYAGEDSPGEIVSALQNGSLFASSRIFLVKQAENIKKKDEVNAFAAYMQNPQDDTVLVLISDETRIDKTLEGSGTKEVFYEMFENQKTSWVAGFFRREGWTITPDAINAVLELVPNNTEALSQACNNLMLFLDKTKPISAAEVETWLSHSKQEDAFSLFAPLAAGDLSKSIEIMRSLLASGETPQSIIPGLSWCYRRLRDKGYQQSPPLQRKNYDNAANRGVSAEKCLALLAKYDVATRSSGSPFQQILMDRLILKLQESNHE